MSPLQRRKKQCPLCSETFFNIPRHLRGRHKYSEEEVKVTAGRFSEKLHFLPLGKLDPYSRCGLCFGKLVRRLGRHLTCCHKLARGDEKYRTIVKESLKERISRRPPIDAAKEPPTCTEETVPQETNVTKENTGRRGANLYT